MLRSLLSTRILRIKVLSNYRAVCRAISTNDEGMFKLHQLLAKPDVVESFSDDDASDSNHSDSDKEPDPEVKIGKQLLKLGKVPYRMIEPLPEWLVIRISELSSHRTKNQIQRCLKFWMLKPDRELQRKYAIRPLGWKVFDSTLSPPKNDIMAYGPEETVAYCHFLFPGRFHIHRRIFREISTLLPKYKPRRVLDFGCGPATALVAARDVWGGSPNTSVTKYCGIDMSSSMLDAAKIMSSGSGASVSFWPKSADLLRRLAGDSSDRFDLAICSYTLTEMVSDPARRAAVQVLYEALDVNGLLLIVEQGNPIGSHAVRSARQFVLDTLNSPTGASGAPAGWSQVLPPPRKFQHDHFRASVVSPCTHDGICPLSKGVWCSFAQRSHSAMIRKDGSEKFSYVVIQKRLRAGSGSGSAGVGEGVGNINKREEKEGADLNDWFNSEGDTKSSGRDPTPLSTMMRMLDFSGPQKDLVDKLIDEVDWDDYNPPLYRHEYGRLIRSPIKATQQVIMDVCQSDGSISRSTLTKKTTLNVPALYRALRKLSWGGLVPVFPKHSALTGRSPMAKEKLGGLNRFGLPNKVAAKPLASRSDIPERKEAKVLQGKKESSKKLGDEAASSRSARAPPQLASRTPLSPDEVFEEMYEVEDDDGEWSDEPDSGEVVRGRAKAKPPPRDAGGAEARLGRRRSSLPPRRPAARRDSSDDDTSNR